MIVAEMGLSPPHNIEIMVSNGRYFIDFDIEYPSGKSFVEAHDVSSDIEEKIRQVVPSVEKITIHMEEHQPEGTETVEATWTAARLHGEIMACIASDSRVVNCSEVTLLEAGNRFNLTFSCQFRKDKPLAEVHQIISELSRCSLSGLRSCEGLPSTLNPSDLSARPAVACRELPVPVFRSGAGRFAMTSEFVRSSSSPPAPYTPSPRMAAISPARSAQAA